MNNLIDLNLINIDRVVNSYPFVLDNLKTHLRIYNDVDNDYISDLAKQACAFIEDWICNNIIDYTTTFIIKNYKANDLIPLSRYKEIVSIQSDDLDVEYTFINYGFDYYVKLDSDYDSLTIVYNESKQNIGYIPHCINLMVADWYENREASTLEKVNVSNTTSTALRRMLGMHSMPVK